MSNTTTDNFFSVWGLNQSQPQPVYFRLYYNDQGDLICYSMEDLPGNYIEIDKELYQNSPRNVQVIDGKIHFITPKAVVPKLIPNQNNGTSCNPADVCVVVGPDQPSIKWSIKHNEINTD